MNIIEAFEDFLDKKVNLNKGRVDRIEEAERILGEFIAGNAVFKDLYIGTTPQGSYRQKTIIKPQTEDHEFDVDLLVALKSAEGWEPKDYVNKLAAEFRASGRYEDLTDTNGKHRCVTIDYEGDFHVDLIPVLQHPEGKVICNKQTNAYEPTDGDGYARWFDMQNIMAHGHLVHVVRLLKYLRDSKGDFDTKSIILTTIAGMQIGTSGNYATLPQAFATVLADMDTYLSRFAKPPSIQNPAMPGETFDRHWKDEHKAFAMLKESISDYARIARDAMREADPHEAITHWKELFGDSFGESGDGNIARSIVGTPPVFPRMPGPTTPPLPPRNREVG